LFVGNYHKFELLTFTR